MNRQLCAPSGARGAGCTGHPVRRGRSAAGPLPATLTSHPARELHVRVNPEPGQGVTLCLPARPRPDPAPLSEDAGGCGVSTGARSSFLFESFARRPSPPLRSLLL